jgi:DNA-directed RNA polymerase specialized sigma24 family protein
VVAGLTTAEVTAEVAALPAALAAPFSLFAFERASYKQIAARLGLPIATVGTRILRARAARLRERLTARHAVTRRGDSLTRRATPGMVRP